MSVHLWAALFGGSLLAFAVLLTLACLRMRALNEPTEPQTMRQYLGLDADTTLADLATDDDAMTPFEADYWRPTPVIDADVWWER
jgi:hypothetical protein